jgi:class 3 adenylate cyclase
MADRDPLEAFLQSLGQLSMTEIVRLQDRLSRELKLRFEKDLALAFSDIVGSTPYFEQFGDEAGRKLQQRHHDLVDHTARAAGGRIVDTAGDGAFFVFPAAEAAAGALIELQKEICRENVGRSREHQLVVRLGFHFGSVLTDGQLVTGESVNLAARVAGSGAPGEIRMTKEAFRELGSVFFRLASRSIGQVALKGVSRPVELLTLDWLDRAVFPDSVRIRETGDEIRLPSKDAISFGRMNDGDGPSSNDVVLTLPDETASRRISRWHFELRRHPDGLVLRQLSDRMTELDGTPVAQGAEVPVRPGTVVRAGRAITLEFFSRAVFQSDQTSDAGSIISQ